MPLRFPRTNTLLKEPTLNPILGVSRFNGAYAFLMPRLASLSACVHAPRVLVDAACIQSQVAGVAKGVQCWFTCVVCYFCLWCGWGFCESLVCVIKYSGGLVLGRLRLTRRFLLVA